MKGMTLVFIKDIDTEEKDAFGNKIQEQKKFIVDDCLISPVSEPLSNREDQALRQGKIQLRVHLPKTCSLDLSRSRFCYDTKIFEVDTTSVRYMAENCPTRWNRYFRAEAINE